MKKATRILAILAEALAVLGLAALIMIIAAQERLKPLYTAMEAVLVSFVIPAGPVVYILCVVSALALLIIATWSKSSGIWPEIITALLLTVSPWLQSGVTVLQNFVLGMRGTEKLAALSVVQQLVALPQTVTGLAVTLALITCGMNIARKKMQ